MVVDVMTKADVAKAIDALGHLLRIGRLLLAPEAAESKAASCRRLAQGELLGEPR